MVAVGGTPFTGADVENVLRHVGVGWGDVVYVHSALHKLGPAKGTTGRDDYLHMFFDAFRRVLGRDGTLVVPTFTTQVMRYGVDYVHEETPSLMGVFSEFVRKQKGAVRRLHPTSSFAALGAHASYICDRVTLRDAGMNSPYERMIAVKAKIVSLGAGPVFAVSLAHHLEGLYGPPHIYNKLLGCRVFKGGAEVKLPFVLGARHLHLNIRYDLTRFVETVERDGGLASGPLGRAQVHKAEMAHVFAVGSRLIEENWFAFLAEPPDFKAGVVPCDGFTAEADGVPTLPQNLVGYYL